MNYWDECIRTSFEENGIIATEEQIKAVVKDIEGAHETYGMAYGHDCIPNPLSVEIQALEQKLRKAEGQIDKERLDFKKNVAMRHHCDISQVSLDGNGHATVK